MRRWDVQGKLEQKRSRRVFRSLFPAASDYRPVDWCLPVLPKLPPQRQQDKFCRSLAAGDIRRRADPNTNHLSASAFDDQWPGANRQVHWSSFEVRCRLFGCASDDLIGRSGVPKVSLTKVGLHHDVKPEGLYFLYKWSLTFGRNEKTAVFLLTRHVYVYTLDKSLLSWTRYVENYDSCIYIIYCVIRYKLPNPC